MLFTREREYSKVPTTDTPSGHGDDLRESPPPTSSHASSRRKFGVVCCVVMATAILVTLGNQYNRAKDTAPSESSPLAIDPEGGDPNPEAPWPRIAWLMSFPNSGTSFTMMLIQRVTNLTAATNYGRESAEMKGLAPDGTNIPLYSDSPGGPFLLSPRIRSVPERYVMTKTHCGGRCNSCSPKRYILNETEFKEWCLRGGKFVRKKSGDGTDFVHVRYDASLVQRAVHLIRDPFDNVVSNFHLEQHEKTKKKDTGWLKKYPNDPKGFQSWCAMLDAKFTDDEKKSDAIDDRMMEMFEKVPCHGDFYRYAQWHNLALKVIRNMKLPTLVMFYENYGKDYEGSVEALLGFLQLPRNGVPPEFFAGKSYKTDFFTAEQRNATMALVRSLSGRKTWELLKRYDSS